MIPCLGQVSIFVVEQFIRNGELPITIQCALHVRLVLGRQDPLPNKDTINSWVLNFHEFLPYFYRSGLDATALGASVQWSWHFIRKQVTGLMIILSQYETILYHDIKLNPCNKFCCSMNCIGIYFNVEQQFVKNVGPAVVIFDFFLVYILICKA